MLALADEVRDALAAGEAVVALESTIIAHGLPRPRNSLVAAELESIVRAGGAVPATIAVIDGVARIGLDAEGLRRIAEGPGVHKLSVRDLAPAVATGATGATTVAATSFLASAAGVRVFATGGLGGVHRGGTYDESADLVTLSRVPIAVVCAGVKSILDVPATLERLESLNVTVVGYRTDELPGFYLHSSGHRLDWRVESPAGVAEVLRARDALGATGAVVVANPVPRQSQLDPAVHDRVLAEALAAAEEAGIGGQAITPFLLERMVVGTDGSSLEANLAAVRSNSALAALVAVELAGSSPGAASPAGTSFPGGSPGGSPGGAGSPGDGTA